MTARRVPLISLVLNLAAPALLAQGAGPAIMYDGVDKFDASFNESGLNGAELYRELSGGNYAEAFLPTGADRVETMRALACSGHSSIVALGFN